MITLIHDLPIDEYHASEFASHSKLRTFEEVGAFGFRARHLTKENVRKRTDPMEFGNIFEMYIQEPKRFAATYTEINGGGSKADRDALVDECALLGVTGEDDDGNAKPFTKRHSIGTMREAIARKNGLNVVSRADMVRIERMAESFTRNPDAQDVCRGLQTQVTLRLDFGGLDMLPGIQARPDWYGDRVFPDLKTCGVFAQFDREILTRGYHSQAGLIDIIVGERCKHPMIVVESDWPYRCQVVDLPHELLEVGREWCEARLTGLRECYARDEWPLCETRRTASVPRWMNRSE